MYYGYKKNFFVVYIVWLYQEIYLINVNFNNKIYYCMDIILFYERYCFLQFNDIVKIKFILVEDKLLI